MWGFLVYYSYVGKLHESLYDKKFEITLFGKFILYLFNIYYMDAQGLESEGDNSPSSQHYPTRRTNKSEFSKNLRIPLFGNGWTSTRKVLETVA